MRSPANSKFSESAPAKSELEVLKVLWKHGPSTVRFVHDTVTGNAKVVRYTSTLKLMQVMAEKGMLIRDETNMKHVYAPVLKEEKTMALVLNKFLHSMFNGSMGNLLVAFMGNKNSSRKELQKLRELLDEMDKSK